MSDNEVKLKRPQLGEWREFSATAIRRRVVTTRYENDRKEWRVSKLSKPGRGMYIGWRTASDGTIEWIDEEGYFFMPTSHRELWLFVIDARQKPIYVFPECVEPAKEALDG